MSVSAAPPVEAASEAPSRFKGAGAGLLICLSLGSLGMIRRWYDLEHLQARSINYYRSGPADKTLLFATIICSVILGLIFWAGWLISRRQADRRVRFFAHAVFLSVLVFPLESARRYWNQQAGHFDLGSSLVLLGLEALLAYGIYEAFRGNLRILNATRRVAAALAFMIPALVIDFGWSSLGTEPISAFADRPSAPMLAQAAKSEGTTSATPHKRVVWLLFDEFDERIAFQARPKDLELPELDRLRSESLVANNAQQTAGWTILAVPSLISGRIYNKAELVSASSLSVWPEGSTKPHDWSDEPNVFRKARDLGMNAAIVGWHHPYCRVLGDAVVRCMALTSGHPTDALLRETHAQEEGLAQTVAFLFRLQFENMLDLFRPDSAAGSEHLKSEYVQRRQLRQYFAIRDRAYHDAADPALDFVYIHFPAPHLFAIYDRKRNDFTLSAKTGYFDNLALVDRTVGELRAQLEKAGMWDSTTLMITSDHGLRPDLWHDHYNWTEQMDRLTGGVQSPLVPFIVKLAGSREPATYAAPFSNVVTGDLALAILGGSVRTPQQGIEWINHHADLENVTEKRTGSATPAGIAIPRIAPKP
jgi:hypothetical protein